MICFGFISNVLQFTSIQYMLWINIENTEKNQLNFSPKPVLNKIFFSNHVKYGLRKIFRVIIFFLSKPNIRSLRYKSMAKFFTRALLKASGEREKFFKNCWLTSYVNILFYYKICLPGKLWVLFILSLCCFERSQTI